MSRWEFLALLLSLVNCEQLTLSAADDHAVALIDANTCVNFPTSEEVGDTLVSAMMMFLGNDEKVYILDKAEGNSARVNGHPAWGAVYDIQSKEVEVMDVRTNVFCASGMHLPNGSFVTFGGNGAVTVGGEIGSVRNPDGVSAAFDDVYQDFDGGRAIRILNPCTSSDNFTDPSCQWFDNPEVLSMQRRRWYSAAEPLANGTVVMIGGFVNGGYINRNYPNFDPAFSGGAAEPTYEFFPSNDQEPQIMDFMIKTSGLNSYAHTFLLPSGKMFVQANISTTIWDYNANTEEDLPDMPGNVARVYPASGAVAMLPLTVENDYTPTILFCGGSDIPDEGWGNYSWPAIDTFYYPASPDCQRITPEPTDGSLPTYQKDDDMLIGRTMGQFIILPTGKLLVVNGGANGTAGYATRTGQTVSYSDMPYGMSLASEPVLTPALYDPDAPAGSRWSNTGFAASTIPRLYHSSAILLPDASVLIAGSNPNVDVNLTTTYPTTYTAELWYPPYFSASIRPEPSGIPRTLSYGGDPFDVAVSASSYSGSPNGAAKNTIVALVRGGWTTHAMNMGQRYIQLNNTYTVHEDGTLVLHVAQVHPNPNIFQPGPALFFVVINDIPSIGTTVIVGSGRIEEQPVSDTSILPASVLWQNDTDSGGDSSTANVASDSGRPLSTGAIAGAVVGGILALAILGALIGVLLVRRRREAQKNSSSAAFAMSEVDGAALSSNARLMRESDSSAFVPLPNDSRRLLLWDYNNINTSPYSGNFDNSSAEFNPYVSERQDSPTRYRNRFR